MARSTRSYGDQRNPTKIRFRGLRHVCHGVLLYENDVWRVREVKGVREYFITVSHKWRRSPAAVHAVECLAWESLTMKDRDRFISEVVNQARRPVLKGHQVLAVEDEELISLYPGLGAFLLFRGETEKTLRKTATVFVFAEGGQLRACLTDRQNERVAWHAAATWADLWVGLEERIVAGTLDWRDAKAYQGKQRGR